MSSRTPSLSSTNGLDFRRPVAASPCPPLQAKNFPSQPWYAPRAVRSTRQFGSAVQPVKSPDSKPPLTIGLAGLAGGQRLRSRRAACGLGRPPGSSSTKTMRSAGTVTLGRQRGVAGGSERHVDPHAPARLAGETPNPLAAVLHVAVGQDAHPLARLETAEDVVLHAAARLVVELDLGVAERPRRRRRPRSGRPGSASPRRCSGPSPFHGSQPTEREPVMRGEQARLGSAAPRR